MAYHFVKVRAERKHKSGYKQRDVIVVNDDELKSFGDKFKPAEADATPEAMEIMWKFEIKPADVEGSGKDGRITKSDVEAMLTNSQKKELVVELEE